MPPKNKAKTAGVSASSFFDLKAELAKQEEDFAKNKAAGKGNAMVVGVKRPDKKPTIWARPNKGVKARATRDIELEAISKPTLESARAALERKAKIYDKLRKGKTGGLNDAQYDALLVDFDSKGPADTFESDSEDEDESLTVPKPSEDDPIVEYEDEFGRLRTAPRSEVPRHLASDAQSEHGEDEDIVIHNPVNHFPTYEPSVERIAAIAEAHSEANNPLGVHYDASAEVRAKGAGFYQFSGDEEERRRQMEELKLAREETERTRKDVGAVDMKPGEVEGMQEGGRGEGSGVVAGKSRAMEKRKRELEERRKMVDAKRRKVKAGVGEEEGRPTPSMPTPNAGEGKLEATVPIFKAVSASASTNPFAALEEQAHSVDNKGKGKGKRKGTEEAANGPRHAADDFLAQLEREMLGGNSTGNGK